MGAMTDFQRDLQEAEALYEQVAEMADDGREGLACVRVVADRAEAVLNRPQDQINWTELRLIHRALYEVLISAERVSRAIKAEERRIRRLAMSDVARSWKGIE